METESLSKLEKTAWNLFSQNVSLYDPLQIISYETAKSSITSNKYTPDAYLTFSWKGKKFKFDVQVTGNQYLEAKLAKLKQETSNYDEILIIVPYISKGISEVVKKEVISCLDLSGNYYIQREELLAIRLDQPDQFKSFSRIKKFYSGSSSMVGRLLLAGNRSAEVPPPSLEGIRAEMRSRGGSLSVSAISKVLTEMERDQVILKTEKEIKVLQPEKLLERLQEQYKAPSITKTVKLNCPEDPIEWVNQHFLGSWVRTGVSSAERYSVSVVERIPHIYVSDMEFVLDSDSDGPNFNKIQNDRFYNLIVNYTPDNWIYFDQEKSADRWSSEIQTYLELSQMDKREKEIAETIKTSILGKYERSAT